MKASTVIVSIRKSCIFTFYHVNAGPNTSTWWKNFGPDLPLLFKLHEICSVDFVKIVATRCQILRLKCTKFDFGWGSAPDPAGGAYSAPANPLAGFGGPTSKGMGGKGRWGEGWERREGEGKGRREERERGGRLLFQTFLGPAPHCTSFRIRASQPIAGQVQMFLKAY